MLRFLVQTVIVLALLLSIPASAAQNDRAFARANPGHGEKRVALVIGNNDYQNVDKLKNAVADAGAFRKELAERGFDVVYRENADRRAMNSAINEFLGRLSSDAVGVVYYAGHGVQINSANFLIPTDLRAEKESDVADDAVDLGRLLDRMAQMQTKFTLAVIDACRDNPFQHNGGRALGSTRGLAPPVSNAQGIMVVYAAGANQRALDRLGSSDTNPNGLFTREFVQAMRQPGLTVQEVVNGVKRSVIEKAKAAGHIQTPAVYDQSVGTFVFTGPTTVNVTVAPSAPATAPQATAVPSVDEDAMACKRLEASSRLADFEAYVTEFSTGKCVRYARSQIAALKAASVSEGGWLAGLLGVRPSTPATLAPQVAVLAPQSPPAITPDITECDSLAGVPPNQWNGDAPPRSRC